jgi:16S rRNA (guanine527-N7)-methyltransferase
MTSAGRGWFPWPHALDAAFAQLDVSRETAARLAGYVSLLERWNRTINLVSARSLAEVWRRHILDSAQLAALIPDDARTIVDLGSGGGLPGLVLACFGRQHVHLVESDRRKAVFLAQAARELGLDATVHAVRIDAAPAPMADVITVRALAPVAQLLAHAHRFCGAHTHCLFLKSQDVASELTAATNGWKFDVELSPSLSDPRGVIVRMRNVERR